MKTRIFSLLVALSLPPVAALAETDTGSAHNLILKYPLGDKWFLSSRNLLTTRDGFDDFFFAYLDLNLGYELGEGWAVAMTVLADERNTAGARGNNDGAPRRMSHTSSKSLIPFAKTIQRDTGTAFDSAAVREKIAHFHMEAQGIKCFSLRLLEQLKKGGPPPTNIPVMKLTTTNRLQQIEAFMMDIQEAGGIVQLPGEVEDKFFNYLTSASNRIAGGADEVLLNQLAERELGMPGEARSDKDVPFSELPY